MNEGIGEGVTHGSMNPGKPDPDSDYSLHCFDCDICFEVTPIHLIDECDSHFITWLHNLLLEKHLISLIRQNNEKFTSKTDVFKHNNNKEKDLSNQ